MQAALSWAAFLVVQSFSMVTAAVTDSVFDGCKLANREYVLNLLIDNASIYPVYASIFLLLKV